MHVWKMNLLFVLMLPGLTARSMPSLVDTTGNSMKKDTVISLNEYSDAKAASDDQPDIISLATPLSAGASILTSNLNSYVSRFISRYWAENRNHLQAIQLKSPPYFKVIDQIFSKYGIPKELRYLAVIESELNPNAVSRVGAVGLWQLMAGTARLLGLTVNRHRDDRRNVYKSTVAAAKYLADLYDTFHDWILVVAAYNCGPVAVLDAMQKSGSSNFFDLEKYLPSETRSHVMRFLATAYTLGRVSSFFGLDEAQPDGDELSSDRNAVTDIQSLSLTGRYALPVIAQFLEIDINTLKRLNPDWDKQSANNTLSLNLPADKISLFKARQQTILNESQQLFLENNRLEMNAKQAYTDTRKQVHPTTRKSPTKVKGRISRSSASSHTHKKAS
ncbi:lytic transglycosylase domain-containing protein [Thermoflavifilum thermophilum]|uniref:Membrane-bound lytic murein transglycosylase D n=1 Tax=Thermoflavifilum thermophilum TaxID=1393122 RepID=A0A1I7NEG0_9BACT|nr:lytic transglycosylase domain-containing protein [Thermoflavifilum thermophilum]SFV33052.1 membrane-bound lytic murein transglycosylase D [Thermoflavifilum thermophilum]